MAGMRVFGIVYRWVRIALMIAACYYVLHQLGAGRGLAVWAIGMAAICALCGLLMKRQTVGKVGVINYAAGYVLPWGYRIGRGKLWPIIVTSAVIWMLIGVAMAMAMTASMPARVVSVSTTQITSVARVPRGNVVMVLLFLAWLIDGGVLLFAMGRVIERVGSSSLPRSLFMPMAVLAGMIVVSAGMVLSSSSAAAAWGALLIAGGPILAVGVVYGLFIIVILTAGKNARWN